MATVLSGQAFIFRSLKEVLAKANELKSGDVLAGVAASSDLERIAAKEVLSQLLLSDLRNHPVVPYEEDGRSAQELETGDRIEIYKAQETTQLIRLKGRSFYQVLQNKIGTA